MSGDPARHFSMIRGFHLADLFTMANGACGVTAILQAMRFAVTQEPWRLYVAAGLVPLAIVFDFLDGRIARFRHTNSPMGRELDSLADVISFGAAPSAVAFAAGLDTALDQVVLVLFTACGLSRLARYNVTAEQLSGPAGKVRYFEGTPITFSVIPLGLLLLLRSLGREPYGTLAGQPVHLASLLFLVSGFLMVSKTIRIPKP